MGDGVGGAVGDGGAVAVHEGLFTTGASPRLLGSVCDDCGLRSFPRSERCGYCGAAGSRPSELPATGRLWAWTAVTAAPPGYRGEVPYGFGVVELDGGPRVIGRLTEPEPTRLRLDQPMEVVVVTLHVGDDGRDVTTYAFAPREPV
ncbi:MAG: Zn-ribbon domain-containing OB-fold protein [Acidimicrobiales bacterium]